MLLYDTLDTLSFEDSAHGREELQAVLDEHRTATNCISPSRVQDVRLDPRTQRTQSGLRYTSTALFSVCRICCPGLSNVVGNLSGDARPGEKFRDLFSVETACGIFNQVVDLRFGTLLSQCSFVVDEHVKRIEGVLGPRTHHLENAMFVELMESLLLDTTQCEFAGASLVGRRLFLRYLDPEPIQTEDGPYQHGYAFFSSEAGDDSIRGYRLYARGSGGMFLQVPRVRQRQKRTGAKFSDRLKALLAGVLRIEPAEIARIVSQMRSTPVFANPDDDRSNRRAAASWRRRFKLAGIPSDIAEGVAVCPFGYESPMAAPISVGQLAEKTEHDLFVATITDAASRGQRVREIVERAAFSVFFEGV